MLPQAQHEAEVHPVIAATREAAQDWHQTPDARRSPWVQPGIVDVRVSPALLDRGLGVVQSVIDGCLAHGMEVRELKRTRGQRPGVGIGRGRQLTAINVEELRHLVAFGELDLKQMDEDSRLWWSREDELRERGWVPRADGRLRLRLPRRYGRPPRGEAGWRFSFTDQVGRPLENQLEEIVTALWDRSADDLKAD